MSQRYMAIYSPLGSGDFHIPGFVDVVSVVANDEQTFMETLVLYDTDNLADVYHVAVGSAGWPDIPSGAGTHVIGPIRVKGYWSVMTYTSTLVTP